MRRRVAVQLRPVSGRLDEKIKNENSRGLVVTGWSNPSGKLPCHFGPPLERGAWTAPQR